MNNSYMPTKLDDIIILSIFLIISIVLLIGTYKKWNLFVNPPPEWVFYPFTRLKKIFGEDFLIVYNYLLGILGVIISVYFLMSFLLEP